MAIDPVKLAELLAELDRLSAESQKIREKIAEATMQRPIFPEDRQQASVFGVPAEPSDFGTHPSSERNN